MHFASDLLAFGPSHVVSIPFSLVDITPIYSNRAHHRVGVQSNQRGVTFPLPNGGDEVNAIKYY